MESKSKFDKFLSFAIVIVFLALIFTLPFLERNESGTNGDVATPAKSQEQILAELLPPIDQCMIEGRFYYYHMGMIYDGSNIVYDESGNQLADCGGGWGIRPDPYPSLCTLVDQGREQGACVNVK